MMLRISASVLLLFSVLFMPFWVSIILALIGVIYFSYFWEIIPLLLLSDSLFGVKEIKYFNIVFVSLIVSIIILLIIEIIKKKLKFYN